MLTVRHALLLSAVVATLAAAGCSAGPDDDQESTQTRSVPTGAATATTARAGLVEAVNLERQVQQARVRVAEQCMERLGFHVHPIMAVPTQIGPDDEVISPPLVSPALPDASASGYGIGTAAASATDPIADPFRELPYRDQYLYYVALNGAVAMAGNPLPEGLTALPTTSPDDGCFSKSMVAVYGGPDAAETVQVGDLAMEVQGVFDAGESHQAAVTDWSACVGQAGYPTFANPAEAYSYAEYYHYPVGARPAGPVPVGGPWTQPEARQKEIELAVVDATCADQTGLREAIHGAWQAAVDQVLTAHEVEIFGWRDQLAAYLAAAQAALAAS